MSGVANAVTKVRSIRSTSGRSFKGAEAWLLVAFDVLLFILAAYVAEAVEYRSLSFVALTKQFIAAPIVSVVVWIVMFERIGLYRFSFAMSVRDEIYIVWTALLLGIIPQFVLFTLVPTLTGSRFVLVFAVVIAGILVGGGRAFAHAARDRAEAARPRRVGIASGAEDAALLARALELGPEAMFFALDEPASDVAGIDGLVERCVALDCAVLYLPAIPSPLVMTRLIEHAHANNIEVAIAPAALRGGTYSFRASGIGRQVILSARPLRVRTAYADLSKRIFDVLFALCVLAIAAPVLAATALAILLETGRPILFRQTRIGLDGIPFEMLKFRSMVNGHNRGNDWATRGDRRITRVGALIRRFSIDELPQFINVLRGEMSVVGPRPELPHYVELFEREIPRYADRHLVKPGITGWSQLYMDRLLTPDDVVDVLRHDLFYVDHWGMFMDLSIVAKTAAEFLFHRAP